MESYIESASFEKVSYRETPPVKGTYDRCRFLQCDFGESDLTGVKFIDCQFTSCNLSLAKLFKTSFQDVSFVDCKMLGMRFDQCNQFGLSFSFERCTLNLSSFYKTSLKKTKFAECVLQEADFTECDLAGSVFRNCDLLNAVFENTTLEKADLRSAINYVMDPDKNKIKGASLSLSGLPGLLEKYNLKIEL